LLKSAFGIVFAATLTVFKTAKGGSTVAIWKELTRLDSVASGSEKESENQSSAGIVEPPKAQRKEGSMDKPDKKESVLGAALTIEGKIEGTGDVRIAGRFKGDVRVDGNLTIEPGAHIGGEISADTVTIGGEVEGNVNASTRVTLLETGQLAGDLTAKSLTVAAGSRMRGRAEFGWDELETTKLKTRKAVG
jgi:cytoskeletal protein CcmA (bactofilin family)